MRPIREIPDSGYPKFLHQTLPSLLIGAFCSRIVSVATPEKAAIVVVATLVLTFVAACVSLHKRIAAGMTGTVFISGRAAPAADLSVGLTLVLLSMSFVPGFWVAFLIRGSSAEPDVGVWLVSSFVFFVLAAKGSLVVEGQKIIKTGVPHD